MENDKVGGSIHGAERLFISVWLSDIKQFFKEFRFLYQTHEPGHLMKPIKQTNT